MPDGISKANARRASKWLHSGKSRAKANLPAKAGRRRPPIAKKGQHITTPEERNRGRFLSEMGLKPFRNPWKTNKPIPMHDGGDVNVLEDA